MPDSKKWYQQPRTWVDLALGAVCIGLLVMMLQQLDSLKKLEDDVDRLRGQLDQKKAAERAAAKGPAAEAKK
jgi:hypothetical protein